MTHKNDSALVFFCRLRNLVECSTFPIFYQLIFPAACSVYARDKIHPVDGPALRPQSEHGGLWQATAVVKSWTAIAWGHNSPPLVSLYDMIARNTSLCCTAKTDPNPPLPKYRSGSTFVNSIMCVNAGWRSIGRSLSSKFSSCSRTTHVNQACRR